MTKEQFEEMERLAKELMDSIWRLEPYQEPPDFYFCFNEGFAAGVESEKKRAQFLVEALKQILTEVGTGTLSNKYASKALAKYSQSESE